MPWLAPIFIAIGFSAATAATLSIFVLTTAASLVLGRIAKMFIKRPSGSSLGSEHATRTVTSRQAVAPWHILYGLNRVGGVITFLGTTGATNEFLQIVITLAGHEVQAIPTMYFDGVAVPLDGSGNATGTYAGFVHAEFNLGTRGQAAFPGLITATASYGATWTSAHRQRGRAGVYVQLKWDATVFANGVPNITFDVSGRKLYDPRSGTIAYSNNAALCIADYLNNPSFGLGAQAKYPLTAAMLANSGFSGFSAANLVDGDVSTNGWSNNTTNSGSTVSVDLGVVPGGVGVISATDTFVRANENPLNASNWTVPTGAAALQVVSNKCQAAAGGWAVELRTGASFSPDQFAEIVVDTVNTNNTNILTAIVRGATGALTYYDADVQGPLGASSPGIRLFKRVAGTFTQLASLAMVVNSGDVLRLEVVGTTLTVKVNGVTKITQTDSSIAVGFPGLSMNAGTALTDVKAGTWDAGNFPGITAEFRRCRMYLSTAGQAQTYDIQYSDDNFTWFTAAAAFLPDALGWNEVELAPNGAHRFWRVKANATITAAGFVNELEFYTSDVDSAALITAANTCDEAVSLAAGGTEPRFTINGSFGSDEVPSSVIPRLNSAMAGSVVYIAGKWGIYPGIWRASSLNLSDADLRAPLTVQTRLTHRDLFNGVKGTFISPTNNWQIADFPPYADPAFLAEDSNERIWQDVEYPFTTSAATCQRISKINLRRVRRQISMQAQFKLTAYQVQPMDVIAFSHPRFGWVNKTFEVTACSLVYAPDPSGNSLAVGVDLTLHESDSTVFDWSTADENSINAPPTTVLPQTQIAQPPTSLSLASDEIVRADGIRMVRIIATWVQPVDNFVLNGGLIHVEYKKHSDTNWIWAGDVAGNLTTATIVPVQDATLYDVRIWSINAAGVASATAPFAVADSFVRANENPLNPANWTVPAGGNALQVVSNKCEAAAVGLISQELFTGASFSADQFCEVVVNAAITSGVNFVAALVRGTTGALTYYHAQANGPLGASSAVALHKRVAGTFTQLGSTVTTTINSGDVLRLEVSGTTLTVKVNGVTKITQTDASIASGFPGLSIGANAALTDAIAGAWDAGNIPPFGTITTGGATSRNPSYSFYRPLTNPLTAHDAGSNVTINIASFTMRVAGLDVSVSSGSIASLSYNTLYYIYYDDGGLAGGAVTFNATTTKETALNGAGRFYIGSIQTPRAGAQDTIGNNDGGSGAQIGAVTRFQMSITGTTGTDGNGTVTNDFNAIDSDQTTFAAISVTGNGATNDAILLLSGPPGLATRHTSITLKVLYSVPVNGFNAYGLGTGLDISYAIQGLGHGFPNVMVIKNSAGTVALALLTASIAAGTNISQITLQAKVRATSAVASGVFTANIYDAWIEAIE